MSGEFFCPGCRTPLEQMRMEQGVFWICRQCGGRALSVELLRHTFTKESINPLWLRAITGAGRIGRACPCCGQAMSEVALADKPDSPAVDVCRICHFVWFDANEIAELKPRATTAETPAERRGREVRRLRRRDLDRPPLEGWWMDLVQFLRLWV
jgi:Zn-finger nucleic acid-binding protein